MYMFMLIMIIDLIYINFGGTKFSVANFQVSRYMPVINQKRSLVSSNIFSHT